LEIPDHFLMDHLSPMVVMKRELGLLKPSEAEAKLLGLYNKWWAENKAIYLVGGDSALFNPSDDLPDTVLRFIQGPSFADHDDPMDEDYDWSAYQAEEDYEEDGVDYEDGNQSYDEEYDYEPEEEQAAAAPPPAHLSSVIKKPKMAISVDPHAGNSSSSRRVDPVSSDTDAPNPPKRRFVGDGYSSGRSYRDAAVDGPSSGRGDEPRDFRSPRSPRDRKRDRSPSGHDLRSRLRESRDTRERGGQGSSSRRSSPRRDPERSGSSSRVRSDNGRLPGNIRRGVATSNSGPVTRHCEYLLVIF